MLKKVKLLPCIAAGMALAILFGLSIYFAFFAGTDLSSALPEPSDSNPYVLIETNDNNYPEAVSALLTEGLYALLRNGTSRNCLLSLAESAKDCAVLVSEENDGITEVYAALRLSNPEMRALSKGELPDTWKIKLKSPRIETGSEKDTWVLFTDEANSPLYFKAERKRLLIAADYAPFKRLLAIEAGDEHGLGRKKWKEEKSWPGHIEICDGGLFFSGGKKSDPLKLQVAWKKLEDNDPSGKKGEAKWTIEGLDKRLGPSLLHSFKPKTWNTSNCIIPEPFLMSVGLNIPDLGGSPDEWPFPLSTIGNMGHTMDLNDNQIREILSGKAILSLGGQNKILWFTLPGFIVELSGEKEELKALVTAFWDKLFFGAEPRALNNFEFGGTANIPFSVVGAGRDNIAVFGLITPESLNIQNKLGKFLEDDEKCIGWIIADLPRVGRALSEMTKMSSFMDDNEDTSGNSYADTAKNEELFQPESSFSPFDQGITDSFGNVLRGFGKVLIIWEKTESGRISWYRETKHQPNNN
jgi:hypothetical protein